MSRPMNAALLVLFMIGASSIIMQITNANGEKSATTIETPASAQAQTARDAIEEQLRELYQERKQILESRLKEIELSIRAGRGHRSAYVQGRKAVLLASLDLCNTKEERLEIRREIVEIHIKLEEACQRQVDAGMTRTHVRQEWAGWKQRLICCGKS